MGALIAGFAAAAFAAELLLHALPYSTGYNTVQVDADNPIDHGTPYLHYTYSRDWSFHLTNSGTLNNEGFRASRDYQPDPQSVVVVGNSFVQADAVLPADTMTEHLGGLLHRNAFAVGLDGFSAADYLVAARWAVERFKSHTVLVLLTTEDLSHSCVPRSGQHHLILRDNRIVLVEVPRPAPSRWKRLLNRSSLFRYMFDNVHFVANWARGWDRDSGPSQPTADKPAGVGCANPAFQAAATRYLLDSFRELELGSAARVIFILAPDYVQRHTVYGAYRDVDVLADRALQGGFHVTRLGEAFNAAERAGVRVDLAPIDHHWSAAGNRIAAQAIFADAGGLLTSFPSPGVERRSLTQGR